MQQVVAFAFLLGLVGATQLSSQAFTDSLRNHVTTCTACHILAGVVKDEAAMKYARQNLHDHCSEIPAKMHKFCHAIVDRVFENGLEIVKLHTDTNQCEAFCGDNEQQISRETLCQGVTFGLTKVDLLMDLLETKVTSICSSEADPESCIAGFNQWKPFLSQFTKRLVLRGAREIDPQNICHIDLKSVAKGETILTMPRFFPEIGQSDSMTCTLCQYMIEGICEMITGNTDSSQQFLMFLFQECQTLLGGLLGASAQDTCGTVVQAISVYVFAIMNGFIWPQACHLVDKQCPVNPDAMCGGAVKFY